MKSLPLKQLLAAAIIAILTVLNSHAMTNSAPAEHPGVKVLMNTTEGPITLLLYNETPKHQANFLKLAREGFYDGLLFHRVIENFMIQGGDPQSRNAAPGQRLGAGDPDYKIDAEIVPGLYHKRGALAAAREGDQTNPLHQSSGSQFYIVTGRTFTPEQLDNMERNRRHQATQAILDSLARENRDSIMSLRRNRDTAGLQALQEELIGKAKAIEAEHPATFTAAERETYTTVGGTPHLDGGYTVYGEVLEGMDTVERIEKKETDSADRPKEDVKIISVKVLE